MADPDTRRAARIAALVAVPVAAVTGFVAFQVLAPADPSDEPAGPEKPVPSTPVEMAAPQLTERAATVCRALFAKLPDRFGTLARRPVTAGPEQNAAFGEPPVTVACGAPGAQAPTDAQFWELSGVCWYQDEAAGKRRWTLQEREVPVVVTMPKEHKAEDLVVLSKPVSDTIAEVADVCKAPR